MLISRLVPPTTTTYRECHSSNWMATTDGCTLPLLQTTHAHSTSTTFQMQTPNTNEQQQFRTAAISFTLYAIIASPPALLMPPSPPQSKVIHTACNECPLIQGLIYCNPGLGYLLMHMKLKTASQRAADLVTKPKHNTLPATSRESTTTLFQDSNPGYNLQVKALPILPLSYTSPNYCLFTRSLWLSDLHIHRGLIRRCK